MSYIKLTAAKVKEIAQNKITLINRLRNEKIEKQVKKERKNILNIWFWMSLLGRKITDEHIIEGEKHSTFSPINITSSLFYGESYEMAQDLLKAAELLSPEEYIEVSVQDLRILDNVW